jgi:hypothetical protein
LDELSQLREQVRRIQRVVDELMTGGVFHVREHQVLVDAASHVRATSDAGQSFAHNTITVVLYEDEDYDALGEYDATTGVFTALAAGRYLVCAGILFAATTAWAATEESWLAAYLGGTLYTVLDREVDHTSANNTLHLAGSAVVEMAAGDALGVRAFQFTGGALALVASGVYNVLTIDRLL